MRVPFKDLKAQHKTIQNELNAAIQQVIEQTAFAGGPFVERFEKDFAAFCNCKYVIACSSGTSALRLALLGFDIGPGDEVITTPNTFIATAEAISACGAKPIFVDIDEKTYNMNPELLEYAITPKTKAVIPVHLYGQVCDMEKILRIADSHGLFVIEDACQAHGAEYKGWMAGSMGDAGCFSFYPGMNLGAYGEAGAVTTNKPELAEKLRMYRDHGQQSKYYHSVVGGNERMDGIQGAILSVKLKYLNDWNRARRQHAHLYNKLLSSIEDIITPTESADGKHVYHIYAIRTQYRDALIKHLAEQGIACGIHYPIPLHMQKVYEYLGYTEGSFPVTEKCARELISLPIYPELGSHQIKAVCEAIYTAESSKNSKVISLREYGIEETLSNTLLLNICKIVMTPLKENSEIRTPLWLRFNKAIELNELAIILSALNKFTALNYIFQREDCSRPACVLAASSDSPWEDVERKGQENRLVKLFLNPIGSISPDEKLHLRYIQMGSFYFGFGEIPRWIGNLIKAFWYIIPKWKLAMAEAEKLFSEADLNFSKSEEIRRKSEVEEKRQLEEIYKIRDERRLEGAERRLKLIEQLKEIYPELTTMSFNAAKIYVNEILSCVDDLALCEGDLGNIIIGDEANYLPKVAEGDDFGKDGELKNA